MAHTLYVEFHTADPKHAAELYDAVAKIAEELGGPPESAYLGRPRLMSTEDRDYERVELKLLE